MKQTKCCNELRIINKQLLNIVDNIFIFYQNNLVSTVYYDDKTNIKGSYVGGNVAILVNDHNKRRNYYFNNIVKDLYYDDTKYEIAVVTISTIMINKSTLLKLDKFYCCLYLTCINNVIELTYLKEI